MFAGILVLVGFGSALWVGWPGYRQYAAIQEIERLGGRVESRPAGPRWARNLVGDVSRKMFADVHGVVLHGKTANDDTLRSISDLSSVTCLVLTNTQVTDAGLAHLKRMPI